MTERTRGKACVCQYRASEMRLVDRSPCAGWLPILEQRPPHCLHPTARIRARSCSLILRSFLQRPARLRPHQRLLDRPVQPAVRRRAAREIRLRLRFGGGAARCARGGWAGAWDSM